jgi:hypothetical protein
MDWKYKHFHQERVFPTPRDLVFEAARTLPHYVDNAN